MIFTKKGFLGTKVIEQLYILSHLTKQTFNTRELENINRKIEYIRDTTPKGDELFTNAIQLKCLNKKKKFIEKKYIKLRAECIKRTRTLEKTFTWKTFLIFYSIANYIFRGYTYPDHLREIISSYRLNEGNIFSDMSFQTSNISFQNKYNSLLLPYDSNWFESSKLCIAFLNGEEIDFKFLKKITSLKVHHLDELQGKSSYLTNSDISSCSPKNFPSNADDYVESPIDLNKHLIRNYEATFLVRAQGESMLGSGITDQSILVVDQSVKPVHNSIIVASIDEQFVCRRLKLKPQMSLSADNPNFQSIHINEGQSYDVTGVVTSIIIKL